MTDLEMTKLCAEAMELRDISSHDERSCWFYDKGTDNVERYDPLHDDAQAMALVKKFGLTVTGPIPQEPTWEVNSPGRNDFVNSPDLNRAIVECVAKMQEAKHTRALVAGVASVATMQVHGDITERLPK